MLKPQALRISRLSWHFAAPRCKSATRSIYHGQFSDMPKSSPGAAIYLQILFGNIKPSWLSRITTSTADGRQRLFYTTAHKTLRTAAPDSPAQLVAFASLSVSRVLDNHQAGVGVHPTSITVVAAAHQLMRFESSHDFGAPLALGDMRKPARANAAGFSAAPLSRFGFSSLALQRLAFLNQSTNPINLRALAAHSLHPRDNL